MRDKILKTILNSMYFSGAQAVSGFWTGGIGAILMLHHVRDEDGSRFSPNKHLQITPDFLDRVLAELQRSGFEFVSLDQIHDNLMQENRDPAKKYIAITLDDGYRDNLQNAVPVFQKHQAPYTIFIAPGLIDGRADLWWEDLSAIIAGQDQISIALPKGRHEFDVSTLDKKHKVFDELLLWLTTKTDEEQQRIIIREMAWMNKIDPRAHCLDQLMNWKEINELSKDPLCTIGAHTIHHYAVARLPKEDAMWEMRESARILEAELGYAPQHFAYPYGYPAAAGVRDFDIARELGFKTAVTTRHGVLYGAHSQHLHALPRISLNGKFQAVRYVETLLSGLPTLMQNKGRKLNVG